MTFRDLKRFIGSNSSSINNNSQSEEEEKIKLQAQRFDIFKGLPFWISDINEHKQRDISNNGKCCFNHVISLPKKDGIEKPIFDYEMQLVNALDNLKSVFVKKARGLGITEILLRYMTWLCVRNADYSGCRFHVVTGPRINLAEELIDRIHSLFMDSKLGGGGIDCKTVGPIIYVNNVTIQAFPSHTISSSRGYTDVKFILIDEGAFFPPGQQEEVSEVSKSMPLFVHHK